MSVNVFTIGRAEINNLNMNVPANVTTIKNKNVNWVSPLLGYDDNKILYADNSHTYTVTFKAINGYVFKSTESYYLYVYLWNYREKKEVLKATRQFTYVDSQTITGNFTFSFSDEDYQAIIRYAIPWPEQAQTTPKITISDTLINGISIINDTSADEKLREKGLLYEPTTPGTTTTKTLVIDGSVNYTAEFLAYTNYTFASGAKATAKFYATVDTSKTLLLTKEIHYENSTTLKDIFSITFSEVANADYTIEYDVPYPTPHFKTSTCDIFDLTGAKHFTVTPDLLNTEVSIDGSVTTVLTAVIESGYELLTPPKIRIVGDSTISIEEAYFYLDNDYKYRLQINYPTVKKIEIYITGEATIKPVIRNIYPFINAYVATYEQLTNLEKKRYLKISGLDVESLDLSKYMLYLFRLYVEVGKTSVSNIYLGQYDSGVQSNLLADSLVTATSNEITINEQYNNILDYDDTSISLYLPFYGFIDLDVNVVMNRKIKLEYKITTVTGLANIFIYADDTLINELSCDTKFVIPYNQGNTDNFNTTQAFSENNFTIDLIPKILIKRPVPIYTNDSEKPDIGENYNRYVINTLIGFVRGEIINLLVDDYCTNIEKENIINLFTQGVIVS